jgi:hypothetical protein
VSPTDVDARWCLDQYFRELAALAAGSAGPLDPGQVLDVMARYATDPYKG